MSALIWSAWGDEWALDEKVSFNGATKQITVNSGVATLDIRTDVYSAWCRWMVREDNSRFFAAIRASGADPIPGGETGVTFFLVNGWKLVYDPNVTAVAGVLYSEDYGTPFWNAAGNPLYPATVSALVNSAVSVQNVVTGTALTPTETADAVWQAAARSLTATMDPSAVQIATAVLAQLMATTIPVDIQTIRGQSLQGDGSEANPWNPV